MTRNSKNISSSTPSPFGEKPVVDSSIQAPPVRVSTRIGGSSPVVTLPAASVPRTR